jgi:hypothetical protein
MSFSIKRTVNPINDIFPEKTVKEVKFSTFLIDTNAASAFRVRNIDDGQIAWSLTDGLLNAYSYTGESPGFLTNKARGDVLNTTRTLEGDVLGTFSCRGYNDFGNIGYGDGGKMEIYCDEDWNSNNTRGTGILLSTANIGTGTLTDKLRLNGDGVRIGDSASSYILPLLSSDTAGSILTDQGGNGFLSWKVPLESYSLASITEEVVNNQTRTSIVTGISSLARVIPANTIETGSTFKFTSSGKYLLDAPDDTATFEITFGSIIATISGEMEYNVASRDYTITSYVTFKSTGATASFNDTTSSQSFATATNTASPTLVNTSVDINWDAFFQWDNAGCELVQRIFTFEKIA